MEDNYRIAIEIKVLPCLACDSEGWFFESCQKTTRVTCSNCGCSGPKLIKEKGQAKEISEALAIEKWNSMHRLLLAEKKCSAYWKELAKYRQLDIKPWWKFW